MQNCPQKAFEKIRNAVLSVFPDQLITVYRKSSEGGNIILKHVDTNKKLSVVVDSGLYCKPGGDINFICKEINNTLVWQFCRNKIENTKDHTGWDFYNPALTNIN